MLDLNLEAPEEFTLPEPDGRTVIIVGLRVKHAVLGVDFINSQKEIQKLQSKTDDKSKKKTKKQQLEDEKKIKKILEQRTDLMDDIIKYGLLDKETKKYLDPPFPVEYLQMHNERTLVEAIIDKTERGAPSSDPLPQKPETKSSEK